eukprot:16434306-Heterocapsa_arctica.AAC.1
MNFQQNKRPRIEEAEDKKDSNTTLLNLFNKRKVERDKHRESQASKKSKTDKKAESVPPPRGTI